MGISEKVCGDKAVSLKVGEGNAVKGEGEVCRE